MEIPERKMQGSTSKFGRSGIGGLTVVSSLEINLFSEDEEDWAPILCPMCRELVTHLTWSPASSILPHEIHDYNRLYRNYSEASRRSLS